MAQLSERGLTSYLEIALQTLSPRSYPGWQGSAERTANAASRLTVQDQCDWKPLYAQPNEQGSEPCGCAGKRTWLSSFCSSASSFKLSPWLLWKSIWSGGIVEEKRIGECRRGGLQEPTCDMTGRVAGPKNATGTGAGADPSGIHSTHVYSLRSRVCNCTSATSRGACKDAGVYKSCPGAQELAKPRA